MLTAKIYQLKISLKDIRPPIWRRARVPGAATLAGLHVVIQTVFGWTDTHLHAFYVGERRYGQPDDLDDIVDDESTVTLAGVVGDRIKRFRYIYDFGDDWMHEIVVEKILPGDSGTLEIACLGGRRRRPPEDCGGPWGYYEFLEAVGDSNHPEHEEKLEWVGGAFDPEAFDLGSVNRNLAALSPQRRRARGAAG